MAEFFSVVLIRLRSWSSSGVVFSLLLLLAGSLNQASPQGTVTASVGGRVLDAGTGEPLTKVQVLFTRLPPVPGYPGNFTATTDTNGQFEMRDLVPGSYRLNFGANGFVSQDYGQRTFPGQGSPVTLLPGDNLKDLTMRLTRTATISGHVRDEKGLPIAVVTVRLLRYGYNSAGIRTYEEVGKAVTDDRGEYRMYWVTPGRYQLAAYGAVPPQTSPPNSRADLQDPIQDAVLLDAFAEAFYPNVADPNAASIVRINPGDDLSGFDFQLTRQDTFRIRGKLVDATTGKSPREASVFISSRRIGVFNSSGDQSFYDGETGSFEIRGVAPGSYTITALVQDSSAGTAGEAVRRASYTTAEVVVANSDVDDVWLDILWPKVVMGRLVVEGSEIPRAFRILFRSMSDGSELHPYGSLVSDIVNSDGKFSVVAVPGEYRMILPASLGFYIKRAVYGGVEMRNGTLQLGGMDPSATLDVTLSPNVAQVTGTVTDEQRQPVAGAQVVLVPDRLRDRPELYRATTTDTDGRYTLGPIAPGDYRVFAWEAVEAFRWFDSDFLKSSENRSVPVRLRESSNEVADVTAFPAESLQ